MMTACTLCGQIDMFDAEEICHECKEKIKTAAEKGAKVVECPDCGGYGRIEVDADGDGTEDADWATEECESCDGDGNVIKFD